MLSKMDLHSVLKFHPTWTVLLVGLPFDTYLSTPFHPSVVVATVFGDTLWF